MQPTHNDRKNHKCKCCHIRQEVEEEITDSEVTFNRVTVETVASSFRTTRKADELYIPPGRLRHYDFIVFDEISQLSEQVWLEIMTVLLELKLLPIVLVGGDFKQLQPINYGTDHDQSAPKTSLEDSLCKGRDSGKVKHIELMPHENARCRGELVPWLDQIRRFQPSRDNLQRMSKDVKDAVDFAMHVERETGKDFTFLTVTNRGVGQINRERLLVEFSKTEEDFAASRTDAADDNAGSSGDLVLVEGARMRLSRNMDKARGFVNSALGKVEKILSDNVIVF